MGIVPGATLGAYRILGPLDRGGMGAVYKGYHPRLQRYVAIKVVLPGLASDAALRARFEQEAVAIARLQHPNILAVYDFAEQDGVAYLVTELLEGGTVAGLVGRPHPADVVARLVRPVAAALDHAHARGMLHRDVKPANIVLRRDGTPVLADFGLAKLADLTLGLSAAGGWMGTPVYMAPEQADGKPAGPATDQYALAVVAYELLTGRLPFEAETPLAVLLAHLTRPLPPPRAANPAIDEAAERALLTALAKRPEDRFPTASAFADALAGAAHLHRAPIHGGSPPPSLAKRPLPAVITPNTAHRLVQARTLAWDARVPMACSPDGRLLATALGPSSAGQTQLWRVEDAQIQLWRVEDAQPVRCLEWQRRGYTTALAFSPDGRLLAGGATDGELRLWRIADGTPVRTLPAPGRIVEAAAFSPDGATLAIGQSDGTVGIWRIADWSPVRTVAGQGADLNCLAFSPDGQLLASGSGGGAVQLWSAKGRHRLWHGHRLPVLAVAFSPDGQTLASASDDRTARLWRVGDGKTVHILTGHAGWVRAVAFSPDGQMVATGSHDGTVRLWRVAGGQLLHTLETLAGAVYFVAFTADGGRLVSADSPVGVWEVAE